MPFHKPKKLTMKEYYGTLSETINGLKGEGYSFDFNIQQASLICQNENLILSPDDFQIDKVFRFEGETNPDDQSILFAISSTKSGMKGLLVNGYGISSDEIFNTLIEKLKTHPLK
jgi:hypothetical protein